MTHQRNANYHKRSHHLGNQRVVKSYRLETLLFKSRFCEFCHKSFPAQVSKSSFSLFAQDQHVLVSCVRRPQPILELSSQKKALSTPYVQSNSRCFMLKVLSTRRRIRALRAKAAEQKRQHYSVESPVVKDKHREGRKRSEHRNQSQGESTDKKIKEIRNITLEEANGEMQ